MNSKKSRQIDVSIRYTLGPSQLLIVVECKRHTRKVDLEMMEGFISKMRDVRANLGIVVSERGFTDGARNLAELHGIEIYLLRDTRAKDWPKGPRMQFLIEIITLEVDGIAVFNPDGSQYQSAQGEELAIFDGQNPSKQITLDDFARLAWEKQGSPRKQISVTFDSMTSDVEGAFKLGISITPHFKRFSRTASLEFIGLTDALTDVTHTDAFKLVTKPTEDAQYFDDEETWKRAHGSFGVMVRTTVVKYGPPEKTLRKPELLARHFNLRSPGKETSRAPAGAKNR